MKYHDKWYSIDKLAEHWGVPEAQINFFLQIGTLKAIINLKPTDGSLFIAGDNGTIDAKPHVATVSGLFEVENYKDIDWVHDENNMQRCDLKDAKIKLRQNGTFYRFIHNHLITPSDIIITSGEVAKFEGTFRTAGNGSSHFTPPDLGKKARESLLKMIFAMAVTHYGYDDPKTKRDAASKIMVAVERCGFTITDDTVRKWLREAEELKKTEED